jgi:hypothetical protein
LTVQEAFPSLTALVSGRDGHINSVTHGDTRVLSLAKGRGTATLKWLQGLGWVLPGDFGRIVPTAPGLPLPPETSQTAATPKEDVGFRDRPSSRGILPSYVDIRRIGVKKPVVNSSILLSTKITEGLGDVGVHVSKL